MKIAFLTPFYKHSDFMAHMSEHCAIHPRWENRKYDAYTMWIDATQRVEVSFFEYESIVSREDIKKILFAPLSQKVVDYEYSIFQEEFGSVNYINRVFEKFYQEIIDPQRSTKPVTYPLKEIQKYFDEHYKHGRYIIFDEKRESTDIIVESSISAMMPAAPKEFSMLEYRQIYMEGEKNFFIFQKSGGIYDIYLFVFIRTILKARDAYYKRYQINSYYTHGPVRSFSREYNIVRINPHADLNIEKEFYETQKECFLQGLERNYFTNDYITALLYFNETMDFSVLTKQLDIYTYEYFMEHIVGNLKNL